MKSTTIYIIFSAFIFFSRTSATDKIYGYPNISATIGQDIEIRCSVLYYSAFDWPDCSSSDCGFIWKFNGSILKVTSTVSIEKFYSFGFMALATGSVEAAEKIGLNSSTSFERNDYFYGSHSNKPVEGVVYLNSVVKISNVQLDDLGFYTCNYSDHNPSNLYPSAYRPRPVSTFEIELKEGNVTTQGIASAIHAEYPNPGILYVQCLTLGAPAAWKARVVTKGCPSSLVDQSNQCEKDAMFSFEDMNSNDLYQCFKSFTKSSSNDSVYGFSIIKFNHVSCYPYYSDDIVLYCQTETGVSGLDGISLGRGKLVAISELSWTYKRVWTGFRNDNFAGSISGVVTILVVFIIVAIILASVRGRCCSTQRTLFATPVSVATQPPQPYQTPGHRSPAAVRPEAPPAYSK